MSRYRVGGLMINCSPMPAMRFCHILHGKHADAEFQPPGQQTIQDSSGSTQKFAASQKMVAQASTGQRKRPDSKNTRGNWFGKPASEPVEQNVTADRGRAKNFRKRTFAHPVDDQINPTSGSDASRLGDKVLFSIDNNVVGTSLVDDILFCFFGNSSEDSRTEMLGPLHQQQTSSSCCCVDKHRIPRPHRPEVMKKVMRGETLHRQSRAFLESNAVR